MNLTVAPQPDWSSGTRPRGVLPNGLSTVQGQVSDCKVQVHPDQFLFVMYCVLHFDMKIFIYLFYFLH